MRLRVRGLRGHRDNCDRIYGYSGYDSAIRRHRLCDHCLVGKEPLKGRTVFYDRTAEGKAKGNALL